MVGEFYGSPARLLYIDVPAAGVYLVIMWFIAQWIVLIPIALLMIFTYLALRRNTELRAIITDRGKQDSHKYEFVTEILSRIHTVKSMAMEPLMLRRFEHLQKKVGLSSYRSILVANAARNTAFLYSNISTISVLTVSATMVILGDLSVGATAACVLLAGQLIQPLMRGINTWGELQKTRHNFNEANKLFKFPKAVMQSEVKQECHGRFCLNEVTFDDAELKRTVIDGFSLSCKPGEILGLQSWDAAERLTLAHLFCGYEQPSKGQILLDRKDLNDPANAWLKDFIIYVPSTPVIFQGTILDNLTMFGQCNDASRAREAAQLLGLEDAINRLPDGYETWLGKGTNEALPKSLLQWINLARAIALEPKVLILDSATQLLEQNTARKVLDALKSLKKDMAIIIISPFETDLTIADKRFNIWGGQLLAGQSAASAENQSLPSAQIQLVTDETDHLPEPTNSIHEQLEQLEAKLTAAQNGEAEHLPAAQACLDPLLMALGWSGNERHFHEALPYQENLETLEDLRAVLFRMHFATEPKPTVICKIDSQFFPCLFVTSDKILVLFSYEDDGSMIAYEGTKQQFTVIRDFTLSGTAYFLTPIDVEGERKEMQKHPWLSFATARFKHLLTLIFTLGFVTSLLALALPIYVINVYDKAIGTDSVSVLLALTIGIIVALATDIMLRQLKGRAQAYFGARLDTLVGNNAFSQLLHMNVSMTEQSAVGSQITRFRQMENLRDIVTGPLAGALIDLPFVIIFIIAIAIIGGSLAWVPTLLVVAYALLSAVILPMIQRNIAQAGEARSKLQDFVLEALGNQRAIRNISAERVFVERFKALSKDFSLKNLRTRAITFNTHIISQTLMLIAGVLTLGIGTIMALNNALTVGALIGVMALVWRVLNPLHQAFISLTRLGQTLQCIKMINKLMRLPVERIPNLFPSVNRTFGGQLDMHRLIFSYKTRKEPVLRGLNCTVAPGEIVVLTGKSGEGKSTMVKAILGLYQMQSGAILADGRDIRQLDPGEWRQAISYVPAHRHLFSGSIADNITLANPTASEVDIISAAKDTGLMDVEFEEFMPDGLDTQLNNQRLHAMPEDMKQRIILARSFAKPASIYLFDTPEQDLGASGIECVLKKLQHLRGVSSVVMLTNRAELIKLADRVLYVHGGQVTWNGTPTAFFEKRQKAA
ncbi:MAG: ATP-binding cassette domain-containing protein [Alphaproteobacteria bacterium]